MEFPAVPLPPLSLPNNFHQGYSLLTSSANPDSEKQVTFSLCKQFSSGRRSEGNDFDGEDSANSYSGKDPLGLEND